MAGFRTLWLYLPRPLRRFPADLAAMVAITVLVNVPVFAPVIRETPLRIVLGLAFVLFVPGYAFIAALFPEAGEFPATSEAETWTDAPQRDRTRTPRMSTTIPAGPVPSAIGNRRPTGG